MYIYANARKFILYILLKGLEKGRDICYNGSSESFGVRRFDMKLIVCMDPRGGMMFNKRRTTSDVVVTADILREAEGGRLLIAPYSEKIFKNAESEGYLPAGAEYTISDDPVGEAGATDTIFLEERSAVARLSDIDTIVIYNWTVIYPFDAAFDIDPRKEGFQLAEQYDFPGYNHDIVTKEVYRRKK